MAYLALLLPAASALLSWSDEFKMQTGNTNIHNYYEMMLQSDPSREALITEGKTYTYRDIVTAADRYRKTNLLCLPQKKKLYYIREEKLYDQLIAFLACQGTDYVPLLVPADSSAAILNSIHPSVPENAIMAVCTSGTSGIPKILFRDLFSWYNFFPIQNEIFQINENTRMFAQGNLAFTGNLNLYLGVFCAGGCVIAENEFYPQNWERLLTKYRANLIYLIPSKLLLFPRIMKQSNPDIQMILSGSQSLGLEDSKILKSVFPNTELLLYYGASELNYITYVTDRDMTEQRNLIGKPFPGVRVFIDEDELFVDTPYSILGITLPYSLRDQGYQDEDGNFYFCGRADDILGIRGRKISSLKIENAIQDIDGILEVAVCKCSHQKDEQLMAYVVSRPDKFSPKQVESGCLIPLIETALAPYEIPKIWKWRSSLPKTDSGKIDKKNLH